MIAKKGKKCLLDDAGKSGSAVGPGAIWVQFEDFDPPAIVIIEQLFFNRAR